MKIKKETLNVKEYDENGKLIYFKNSSGYEEWKEYDDSGNIVHYKDSNEFESWTDYNINGFIIHYKDSHGYEYWKDYDDNGIRIDDSYEYECYPEESDNDLDEEKSSIKDLIENNKVSIMIGLFLLAIDIILAMAILLK